VNKGFLYWLDIFLGVFLKSFKFLVSLILFVSLVAWVGILILAPWVLLKILLRLV